MLTRCHLETIWPQVIFEFKTEENQFTIKGFVDISLIEKKNHQSKNKLISIVLDNELFVSSPVGN